MLPEVFPPARVGQAQGLLSGMFAAGAAAGLVGGGYIAQTYGWQLTYHTVIPVAVLVIILAFVYIRESKVRLARKIDFPGVVSLGVGLTLLMLGITEGAYWGWTNFTSVVFGGISWGVPEFLILAAVAFAFFFYWEPRAPSPVVSFKSLKERNILVSNINGVIVGMAMFLLFTILIILGEYPSPGFGLSELNAGLILVPAVISMLVTGPFLGRAISHYGPKPVMVLGFVLIIVGAFGLVGVPQYDVRGGGARHPDDGRERRHADLDVEHHRPLGRPEDDGDPDGHEPDVPEPRLGARAGARDFHTRRLRVHGGTARRTSRTTTSPGTRSSSGSSASIGVVGLLCSLGLRNFRFLADGTRSGQQSGAPVPEGETRQPVTAPPLAPQPIANAAKQDSDK